MTKLLWDSFYSLDFVTQGDLSVVREFKHGEKLIKNSIVQVFREILECTALASRVILFCCSLLYQLRGTGWPAVIVGVAFGAEIFIFQRPSSPQASTKCSRKYIKQL
jgi:hypothetical protein